MNSARRIAPGLGLALAVAAVGMPGIAQPQAVVVGDYFVKNNSGSALRCTFRRGREGEWQPYVTLPPAEEFAVRQFDDNERLYFFCSAPMRRAVFRLQAGERYSLLAREDGEVRLFRIDPGAE